MKPKNDKQFDFPVSDKLADDLKSLYEPPNSVSPQVDRAVMDRAARVLIGRPKRRRFLHWPVYVASAAAIIVVCFLVTDIARQTPTDPVAGRMDINSDGVVDVLDAFQLARQVNAEQTAPQWDMNHDGVVDDGDVDWIASAAVRLNQEVL